MATRGAWRVQWWCFHHHQSIADERGKIDWSELAARGMFVILGGCERYLPFGK